MDNSAKSLERAFRQDLKDLCTRYGAEIGIDYDEDSGDPPRIDVLIHAVKPGDGFERPRVQFYAQCFMGASEGDLDV